MNDLEIIIRHYESCWGQRATPRKWTDGPFFQLPPDFCVLEFPPNQSRRMWTYATAGMSMQADVQPLEIHLFSPEENTLHLQLLTAIAHYHLTGAYLDLGHVVNFGRPWLSDSKCDHGLLSLPYLDGPKLEFLGTNSDDVRFLWLIPITEEEANFAKQFGLEALEQKFEGGKFNYLESSRASVV